MVFAGEVFFPHLGLFSQESFFPHETKDATLSRVFCTSGNYVDFSSLGVFHIRMQHSVELFGTSGNVTLRNLMKSVARLNAR
jgi:hypothetical protein